MEVQWRYNGGTMEVRAGHPHQTVPPRQSCFLMS